MPRPQGTPRRVKILGLIGLLLVVAALAHLFGLHGSRWHGDGSDHAHPGEIGS